MTVAWLGALGIVFLVGSATTASGKQRSRKPVVTSASHETCMAVPDLGPEYQSCCVQRRKFNEWMEATFPPIFDTRRDSAGRRNYHDRSHRLFPKAISQYRDNIKDQYCVQTVSTTPMCAYVTRVVDQMDTYKDYALFTDDRSIFALARISRTRPYFFHYSIRPIHSPTWIKDTRGVLVWEGGSIPEPVGEYYPTDYLLDTPDPAPEFSSLKLRVRKVINRRSGKLASKVGLFTVGGPYDKSSQLRGDPRYTAGNIQRQWSGSCVDGLLDGPGTLHTTIRNISVDNPGGSKERTPKLKATTQWTKEHVKVATFRRGHLVYDGHFAEKFTCLESAEARGTECFSYPSDGAVAERRGLSYKDQSFKDKEMSGLYVDGKRHGHWRIKVGRKIEEGSYINGVRDGHWRFKDGPKIEEGSYINGVKDGHWRFVHGSKIEEGSYVNDLREGVWIIKKDEFVTSEGSYINGFPDGVWVEHREFDDERGGGNYIGGLKHGDWVELYGEIGARRGAYLRGKRHGPWADGELISGSEPDIISYGIYRLGKKHGDWIEKRGEQHGGYVNGKKHGDWVEVYSSGRSDHGSYRRGDKVGYWVERGDAGSYVNGKRHGEWKISSGSCRIYSYGRYQSSCTERSDLSRESPEPRSTPRPSFLDSVLSVAEIFLGAGSTSYPSARSGGGTSSGTSSGSRSRGSSASEPSAGASYRDSCSAGARYQRHSPSGHNEIKVQFAVSITDGCSVSCNGWVKYTVHYNYKDFTTGVTQSSSEDDLFRWRSTTGARRMDVVDETKYDNGLTCDGDCQVTHIQVNETSCSPRA